VRIELERDRPARIFRFEIQEAPPVINANGRYSGRFDIGGRKLFLHCEGSGTPTVIFEGGLTTDWPKVQDPMARFTRACSYDPANAPWGRSDAAPTPRTAKDVVADLHALLAAAKVPGPYVLAGHSNGGLFVQLYAAEHPDEVAGLVLIDAVHPDYYARQMAVLKKLAPPSQVKAAARQLETRQPAIVDPEQIEPLDTSLAQTRAALAAHPLRPMPLFVLTRGHQPGSPPPIERLWRTLQDELAALVPHSRHVIAKRSSHIIQDEQPDLVVAAIRDVVQAVRRPASWRTP
jgi:pimeloyl-ACP methyl ester carboxylesterase